VEKALKKQTFTDWEWIIPTPDISIVPSWATAIEELPKPKDLYWQLNRSYNEAIRQSSGELIVSIQDFTYFKPEALELFWYHYQDEPKTLVTGVGNKYEKVVPFLGAMTWKDPRERSDQGDYYKCFFQDIEANFCSVPKEAFYAVGGFDEELDKYAGMDFYSVVDRLNDVGGWEFCIDQTIKSFSLPHPRLPDWEEKNLIHGGYNQRKKQLLDNREWPVLQFLLKGG
jgi:hypothetical protein